MPEFLSSLDPIVRQIIYAVFPATGLSLALFGVLWWSKGPASVASSSSPQASFASQWPLAALGPIVILLVSFNVFALLNYNEASGWPRFLPGRDVRSLWPTIVTIAAALGLATSLFPAGLARSNSITTLRLGLRGLLAAGLAALILRNVLKNTDVGSLIVILAGVGVLAVLIMQGLERTARADRGFLSALLLFIPVASAGQVILIGFTEQTPAFAMVAISVIIAVAGVLALLRPRLHLAFGFATTAGLLLTVALFQSAYFGSANGGQAALYIGLLLLSIWLPALIDIVDLKAFAARFFKPAKARVAVAFVKLSLTGLPAAAAVGSAIYNKPPPF